MFGLIRDNIRLANNSRRTNSGNWDKRFKATRELEKKAHMRSIIISLLLLLVILLMNICSNKKDNNVNNNPVDTIIVEQKKTRNIKKSQPVVLQNDNNNIDTLIQLDTAAVEDINDSIEPYIINGVISLDSIKERDNNCREFNPIAE